MKTHLLTVALLAAATAVGAQTHSSYAGQEQRPIKALSPAEVTGLAQGQGMGFAKAAELNGYPGPMHVLELARRLDLTAEQRAASERLMAEHKARAREIGERVIAAERTLDALFAERRADAAAVDAATRRVGELQAELRAEHLKTHLAQTALLDAQQVARYVQLRGYAAPSHGGADGHSHHRH
jgi:Spy/CpxP family protein refolding chaperone